MSDSATDPSPGNNAAIDSSALLPPGALGASPNTLAFGTVSVGATSASQIATLSNSGGSPLTVSSLSPAAAPFALAGGSCGVAPFNLAAGASCTVQYRFAPTASGSFSQTVTVSSNAGTATANLLGVGVVVTAVDTLDARSLALLSLLFGLVGWAALRRRG